MNIIYHCYGGAHSSVTAAAVHLGWLPTDRLPERQELESIPYFDRPVHQDHGFIRFMGRDSCGHAVYVLGRRNAARIFDNMVSGLLEIYGCSPGDFVFVNVMPYVNWKMMLGGYTSRKMGWARFGRPIIVRGTKYSYWKIVSLVQQIRFGLSSGDRENKA